MVSAYFAMAYCCKSRVVSPRFNHQNIQRPCASDVSNTPTYDLLEPCSDVRNEGQSFSRFYSRGKGAHLEALNVEEASTAAKHSSSTNATREQSQAQNVSHMKLQYVLGFRVSSHMISDDKWHISAASPNPPSSRNPRVCALPNNQHSVHTDTNDKNS